MRTLLAALILVPALALAQEPLELPTSGPSQPPPPQQRNLDNHPRPLRQPGANAAPGAGGAALPTSRAPAPAPASTPAAPAPAPAPGGRPTAGGEATIRPVEGSCVPLQGRFMLSFNKADIVDVLEQASRWTCRNFIYTDDVARGKITLLSKTPVTSDEAYAAFLSALAANNITVFATGKYYKLGRTPDSKKLPIPTYTDAQPGMPANEQVATKVIRLQSADADLLRGVLGNFISPQGADIQSIPPDTLIITDTGLNIRRLERMIESIDRPGGGDLIRVVQLRYAPAKDVADKLNQIFQAQGAGRARRGVTAAVPPRPGGPTPGGPTAPAAQPGAVQAGAVDVSVTKVLADERTNKLIVIADEKSFQRLHDLLEQLDVPTSAEGGVHVVFLKNASAEELATTLSSLAQGKPRTTTANAPAAPGQAPGTRPVGTALAAPTAAEGAATAELFSGEVKITADKAQNALLIQASGADFAAMSRLIEKLDRPRRQVFVEAVVMEVNISHSLNLGVSAHALVDVTINGKQGVLPLVSNPSPSTFSSLSTLSNPVAISQLGGFLTGFAGPNSGALYSLTGVNLPSLGVLVQALQSNSDVNVISTPHVLATDNEDSEITVGQNVPFQTGYFPSGISNLLSGQSSTSTGTLAGLTGTSGLSSLAAGIQRQNVELKLKMKPQITEGGNVRLTVELQNEEIASTDPTLGPTTAKRSVKTEIVAHDESTIVIGGLIQDRNTRSVEKIPLLGSLPVLGALFRSTSTIKQKTNLLVFLTPYIIRDEADYRRIYEKKRKEEDEFMVQFYGQKSPVEVDIDYGRKPGPLTFIHRSVAEEGARLENGGAGLPGEGMASPPGGPATAIPPAPLRIQPLAPAPEPQPEPQPELQPEPPPAPPPGADDGAPDPGGP